jgi:hypothetical protein
MPGTLSCPPRAQIEGQNVWHSMVLPCANRGAECLALYGAPWKRLGCLTLLCLHRVEVMGGSFKCLSLCLPRL